MKLRTLVGSAALAVFLAGCSGMTSEQGAAVGGLAGAGGGLLLGGPIGAVLGGVAGATVGYETAEPGQQLPFP